MTDTNPFLNDEDIGALIDRKIRSAIGENGTRLEREREEVLRFYNGELPKPQHSGSSTYVSTDVYDAIQSMKAQLLETFATGRDIIKFTPQNAKDVEAARIATEYTNFTLFRKNDGFSILDAVIDDALKARVGIVKVYWEGKKELRDEGFGPIDALSLEALAGSPDIKALEANVDGASGIAFGKLSREHDVSQVRIEIVPPEHFGIDNYATSLQNAFHFYKTLKTKSEIADMGFDVSLLDDKAPDGEAIDFDSMETQARFEQIDNGMSPGQNETRDIDRPYWLYECYDWLTDENGARKLYRVVRCASVTLAMDEVSHSPFRVYTPLPVPHAFYGDCFAKRVIPYQKARTALTRAILDHAAITTNPRYLVAKGSLSNPRELLENRAGGLVNTSDINSVMPLPQAPLNPFIFQTLNTLQENAEATTGISALSQGLDKSAISTQNSQGLVNDLVNLSQTRQKVMARNLAYNFLVPLYIEIYRLIIENDDQIRENEMEIAGNFVEINPQTWIERKDAEPDLHLSQQDAQLDASKFMMLLQARGQDPQLGIMMGPQGTYNAYCQVLKLGGIKNVNDYLTPPNMIPPPPPPQPDPMAVAQLQLQSRQVAVQEMAAQIEAKKVETDSQVKMMKAQIDQLQASIQRITKLEDSKRKDIDLANRVDITQREMAIEEANPTPTDVRGIDSSPKP